jgi:hypothetical protein
MNTACGTISALRSYTGTNINLAGAVLYQPTESVEALSKRIGHADVTFTMKQYVQTDLEADRQVANTLAELADHRRFARLPGRVGTREGAA